VANEADVLKALEKVPGPGGVSLAASNAVSGINVSGAKAFVSISGDPARAKEWEAIRLAAERAVGEIGGVERAIVTLTAERAARPEPARDHHHDHGPAPAAPAAPRRGMIAALERIRFVVAVASGKGGVGKSTTAANLALGLAAQGWRVGLLDADIYGPSAPRLFGLHGKPQVADGKMVPLEAYGVKVMSIGFLVEEETPMIWRGPMVMSALTQMLREVDWGTLDVLVVDMPPGTGDAQLTMAQAVPLKGAVIVSTPQDLALIDARRGIAMFRRVNVPVIGIVENMSTFICPHCGTRSDIFGHGGARREAERLGVPFLGEVPLDMIIREKSDAGLPVVATAPDSPLAQSYRDIAALVRVALQGASRPVPKFVIEA